MRKLWVSDPFLNGATFTYGELKGQVQFTETKCYVAVDGEQISTIIERKSSRRFITSDKRTHTTFRKALAHWCETKVKAVA